MAVAVDRQNGGRTFDRCLDLSRIKVERMWVDIDEDGRIPLQSSEWAVATKEYGDDHAALDIERLKRRDMG